MSKRVTRTPRREIYTREYDLAPNNMDDGNISFDHGKLLVILALQSNLLKTHQFYLRCVILYRKTSKIPFTHGAPGD